ncbi:MAG: phospho-sugar mutase [Halioglobus sp.]
MKDRISTWLARDPDPASRDELQSLLDQGNTEELSQRFSGRLEFGTAGLRGLVGAGPARMNRLVIQETSAGLGTYLIDTIPDAAKRGIVVAYDGRPDSHQFAMDAACVFAALGITVYITPAVAATPIAAFGVLNKGAAAGVVVTASHNPPQYNGYKVFWGNGAQITPPHDAGIANAIEHAALEPLPWLEFEEGVSRGVICVQGEDFYRSYIDAIQASPLFSNSSGTPETSIAYTAMHGVGADVAETLLQEAGFRRFYSVESQREPDGRFPTVNFPNPEEPGAMDLVLALASENGATLACANDPDADRLAVAVRQESGDYQMLTGDMVGVLLANYLLQQRHSFTPIVCSTIVSSSMLKSIAAATGAVHFETLTGFKWLTNVAMDHEDANHQLLFAYEEALGYAVGRQVRDKDGLSALLAFAQMTEQLSQQGRTVLDQLESLYRQHGIFMTGQRSIALQPGSPPLCDRLRDQPPSHIGSSEVTHVDDLSSGIRMHSNGSSEPLDFPLSDVLIYRLQDGSRVIVRPSGTEPKVKCYYEVVQPVAGDSFDSAMEQAKNALAQLMEKHQDSIAVLTRRG